MHTLCNKAQGCGNSESCHTTVSCSLCAEGRQYTMPGGHSNGVTKVAPHASVAKTCSLRYKDNVDVAVE